MKNLQLRVDNMPLCPKCHFKWVSTIRSNPQNRYYFGVCVDLISEHTGFTQEEVHEILKHKFLAKRVLLAQEYVDITKTTTELSTSEFKHYIEQIQRWASMELSIVLPDPNEKAK